MASPFYHKPPTPPGLWRAARAFRRASTIALVLIVVFVAFVAYSAVQVVKAKPGVGSSSSVLEPNDTVGITTSFSLTNPTYFAIQDFALHFLVLNATGASLVDSSTAPESIPAGGSALFPVALYVPLSASSEDLLTENQYLDWNVWGNASYAYLFSVSIGVDTERAWGAPFDNLTVSVGTPFEEMGVAEIPVTVTFADDASYADVGDLNYQVLSAGDAECGSGGFALDVPSGEAYDQTQDVALATGCNPAGGQVTSEYVENGETVPLPPEPIP